LKQRTLGFSDEQICRIMKEEDSERIYERRKQWALPVCLKWWIPAVLSLKQRHLTSILHLKTKADEGKLDCQ
jgi:hypothetical protein